MIDFEAFHFLRPLWLLSFPIIALLWWTLRKRSAASQGLGISIAPHLLSALTVNKDSKRRLLPMDGLFIAIASAGIAAAGPTWSQQPSPWFSETAPLIIAFEVSDSMRSNDLQPTRIDRARFKILDLLELRTGARTGLIAYAGSAHVVVPPTTDTQIIKTFLESLDPAVMPISGSSAAEALPVAQALLKDQAVISTLLFVNDGFESEDKQAFESFNRMPNKPALVAWVIGTEEGGVVLQPDGTPMIRSDGRRVETELDTTTLREISSVGDISIVRVGNGDSDTQQVYRKIESNLKKAKDPNARWKDQGWWALWPAAIIVLLSFRKGWTQNW